jgi:hypothetical protein
MVNGGAVLLENDGGVFPVPPAPGACWGILHCGGYTLKSMGLNTTRVSGRRVILTTDFNRSFTGVPLAILAGFVDTARPTIDVSTAAAIPNGQPAPPLDPFLLDFFAPVITAVPDPLAFNIASQSPDPVSVAFTLSGANPLEWHLTLLNKPLNKSYDLTRGFQNVSVSPIGEKWAGSPLTVTVTMNKLFLTSLTADTHQLYMTAVSKRGLSAYKKLDLKVS